MISFRKWVLVAPLALTACEASSGIVALENEREGISFITNGDYFYFGPTLIEPPNSTLTNPTGEVKKISRTCSQYDEIVISYSERESDECHGASFKRSTIDGGYKYSVWCDMGRVSDICPPNLANSHIMDYTLSSEGRLVEIVLNPESNTKIVLK